MEAMILNDRFAASASRPAALFGTACGARLKRSASSPPISRNKCRTLPQFGRERAEIEAASWRHPNLVIEGTPLFLEDEFAIGRIRLRRISVSFLVAVTVFVACVAATLGLASAARAAETQQTSSQLAALGRPNDVNSGSLLVASKEPSFYVEAPWLKTDVAIDVSGPIAEAATMLVQKSSTVNLPQTAMRADEQITRGFTMLLLALMAASGLAVWRRRLKSVVMIGAKRDGR
ncbi:Vault protein inter-alpha-trypsin domain-containing protein [Rhizobium sp. CCGE 510]|nr:Vault protein inter-alpha-trypsin domain-containing protein [Rhizobium sp. CCGE 510]